MSDAKRSLKLIPLSGSSAWRSSAWRKSFKTSASVMGQVSAAAPQPRARARGAAGAGEMRRRHRTPLTGLPPPNAEEVVLEPVIFSAAFRNSGLTPRVVVQALQPAIPEQFWPRTALHLPPVSIGEVGRRGVGLAFRSGKRCLVGKKDWSRILAASGGENSLDPALVDAVTRALVDAVRDPAGVPPLVGTMMVLLDSDHAEMQREGLAAAAAGNGAALGRLSSSCANGSAKLWELATRTR